MRYLVLALLFIGCNNVSQIEPPKTKIFNGEYALICEKVFRYTYRCENKEVVCYREYDGGMDCEFKR